MATYLFTWNPDRWVWKSLKEDSASYERHGFFDGRWSCGATRKIVPGDRVFLIKIGNREPKGILASGFAISAPFEASHYLDPSKTAHYTNLRYDVLLNPDDEKLLRQDTLLRKLPDVRWSPQGSGMTINPEAAAKLEELWSRHLTSIGLAPQKIANEVITPERYPEGSVRQISVNAYERDPRVRKACLAHHGCECSLCGFSFSEHFGSIGDGFIHVHHLIPLADMGEDYEVNPITDLIPVCPNCHAMLHRRIPPYTPEELRNQTRTNGGSSGSR